MANLARMFRTGLTDLSPRGYAEITITDVLRALEQAGTDQERMYLIDPFEQIYVDYLQGERALPAEEPEIRLSKNRYEKTSENNLRPTHQSGCDRRIPRRPCRNPRPRSQLSRGLRIEGD